ncbi:hypothetical protein ABW19_dt0203122 [Dactylella cylindrospora]|nr:hypothetical protein ABW19_dt0203122 [Dactylella cylindrospora]
MEGFSSYPPPGGYPNNQRNSYPYPNQYHPSAQNPQSQQQQQQQPVPSLYHPQQTQQYAHQAYQPPTRQLRSYNSGMPQYGQMNPQLGQFQQAGQPMGQPQQPYQTSYQQTYQPPQHYAQAPQQAPVALPPAEPEAPAKPPPKPVPQVNIKTKFPVARIKRIMQADEDVGKVAQVTPVIVSKALELFMVSLVTKAADQAKSRGSKRITAGHLKAAVNNEEQFDFLSEIISKAPDIPAASEGGPLGGKAAAGAAASGPGFEPVPANMNNIIEEDGAAPKKGRRGRKKKVSSDDDDF